MSVAKLERDFYALDDLAVDATLTGLKPRGAGLEQTVRPMDQCCRSADDLLP